MHKVKDIPYSVCPVFARLLHQGDGRQSAKVTKLFDLKKKENKE